MANPLNAQIVDRVPDRLRPAPFTGVGGQAQPCFARHVKSIGKIPSLAHILSAAHAKANNPVPRRLGSTKGRFPRFVRAEVADAGDDPFQRDPVNMRLLHGL